MGVTENERPVEIGLWRENLRDLNNWKAHILLTLLRTSHMGGKRPPLVDAIFKKRNILKVNSAGFQCLLELGNVSFTEDELSNLIDYVADAFGFATKNVRDAVDKIDLAPNFSETSDQLSLEVMTLFDMGEVITTIFEEEFS